MPHPAVRGGDTSKIWVFCSRKRGDLNPVNLSARWQVLFNKLSFSLSRPFYRARHAVSLPHWFSLYKSVYGSLLVRGGLLYCQSLNPAWKSVCYAGLSKVNIFAFIFESTSAHNKTSTSPFWINTVTLCTQYSCAFVRAVPLKCFLRIMWNHSWNFKNQYEDTESVNNFFCHSDSLHCWKIKVQWEVLLWIGAI